MPEQLPAKLFQRLDESDDSQFYGEPRKVVHIDDQAIAAAARLYAELIPRQADILDLMSSWRSHLLPALKPASVVGLGMNAAEMADNPQLSRYVVHDLNADPCLPFPAANFDAAVCTVSVQYLTRPIEVFASVCQVLKPGAPFITTFSNRCFPTKAVHVWRSTNNRGHLRLVQMYFEQAGGWERITMQDRSPRRARWSLCDPLFAVWAYKA